MKDISKLQRYFTKLHAFTSNFVKYIIFLFSVFIVPTGTMSAQDTLDPSDLDAAKDMLTLFPSDLSINWMILAENRQPFVQSLKDYLEIKDQLSRLKNSLPDEYPHHQFAGKLKKVIPFLNVPTKETQDTLKELSHLDPFLGKEDLFASPSQSITCLPQDLSSSPTQPFANHEKIEEMISRWQKHAKTLEQFSNPLSWNERIEKAKDLAKEAQNKNDQNKKLYWEAYAQFLSEEEKVMNNPTSYPSKLLRWCQKQALLHAKAYEKISFIFLHLQHHSSSYLPQTSISTPSHTSSVRDTAQFDFVGYPEQNLTTEVLKNKNKDQSLVHFCREKFVTNTPALENIRAVNHLLFSSHLVKLMANWGELGDHLKSAPIEKCRHLLNWEELEDTANQYLRYSLDIDETMEFIKKVLHPCKKAAEEKRSTPNQEPLNEQRMRQNLVTMKKRLLEKAFSEQKTLIPKNILQTALCSGNQIGDDKIFNPSHAARSSDMSRSKVPSEETINKRNGSRQK